MVNDCAEILPLVDKLYDSEASASERLAAEAHLEKCASCRSHFEFLDTLSEESRSMTLKDPPESYWEHLPRKVLDRIESEEKRPPGFLAFLLLPSTLKWSALGATLVLAAAVGVSILREQPLATPLATLPHSAPPASLPAAEPPVFEPSVQEAPDEPQANAAPESPKPAREAPAIAERLDVPMMARDEALPAAEESEAEQIAAAPPEAPAPADSVATLASSASKEGVAPSRRKENEKAFESANRPRAAAESARLSRAVLEDCELMRREVATLGATPKGADARYRLALCSLQRHERDAPPKPLKDDELEARAVEDAEAFLAIETEGARAEEVREKLRRIKQD